VVALPRISCLTAFNVAIEPFLSVIPHLVVLVLVALVVYVVFAVVSQSK